MRLRSLGLFFESSGLSLTPLARTLARKPRRPCPVQALSLRTYSVPCRPSMRNRELDSHFSERVSKRRRIPSPQREASSATMNPAVPTLELTPIESTLRTLLLDVANYIREKKLSEGGQD